MASPSDENENEVGQGEDMQETRELGPKEDDSSGKSKQVLIGILSLVVFFTLLFVFQGEEQPSVEENVDIGASIENQPTSPVSPTEKSTEEIFPKTEPNAGQVVIQTEEALEMNPPSPPKKVAKKEENKIIPIPQEELVFVDPFDPNKGNRKKKKSLSSASPQKVPLAKKAKPARAPTPPKKKPPMTVKRTTAEITTRSNPAKQEDHLYAIQLGAFKEKTGAEVMADRLRKGGFDSYVLTEKGQLFRVRVGDFKSRGEAKKVASRIRKAEKLDSFITVD
ncbi:MAG: SPOR domain-containing protein [Nitrospiria bacterium]